MNPTIIKTTLLMSILLPSMCFANVETFKPEFPKFDRTQQNTQTTKVEYLGFATLNAQVKIPTYAVSIDNPFSSDGLFNDIAPCTTAKTCQFNFNLPKAYETQFKILLLSGIGPVLVPQDWNIIRSSMGASSVASAQLFSPDQQEVITIDNTASCAGCGMHQATLYFPEILKKSLKYEFGAIQDKNKFLNLVKVNKRKVYLRYQIPHYPNKTHGIAYYADEDDGHAYTNFQKIEVSLKPEHKELTRYILNFYQSTH